MGSQLRGFLIINVYFLTHGLSGFGLIAQSITFQKVYVGLQGENISRKNDFLQTADSGFIMGGSFRMVKSDNNGNLQWIKKCDNPGQSFIPYELHNTGGYYTAGFNLIVKLDSNYNFDWVREITNNGFNYYAFMKIEQFSINKYIFAGVYGSSSKQYLLITSVDDQGNFLFSKIFWLSTTAGDDLGSMAVTKDNGIIVCGRADSVNVPFVSSDGVVFKIDSLGNFQWGKRFSFPTQKFRFDDLVVTPDSGYAIIGRTLQHGIIVKLDSSGNTLWMKFYESGIDGDGYSIDATTDGGLIAAGRISDTDSFGFYERPLLYKTDNMGNIIWARVYSNYGYCRPSSVNETFDGGFAILTETTNPGGGTSFGLIKTDSLGYTNGCSVTNPNINVSNLSFTGSDVILNDSTLVITTTLSSYAAPIIGSEITLCSSSGLMDENLKMGLYVYPNPNRGKFSIIFKDNIKGEIEIFDFLGKSIFKQPINASFIDVELPLKLRSGIYSLKVTSKNSLQYSKVLIQ